MDTTDIETVIIGAGQAGLSTGYHLQRRGRPFVILDAAARVGDQWRRQWDSLRLYSPAKYDGLPGLPFPGDRWSFPGKDEVADYLEQYAAHLGLPVRLGTRVERPDAATATVATSSPRRPTGRPHLPQRRAWPPAPSAARRASPTFAGDLDPAILQLHSSEYRRPGQLRDGPVLVVGASHSGTDIAYELAETHPTILAGRDCGQIPAALGSWLLRVIFPVVLVRLEARPHPPHARSGARRCRTSASTAARCSASSARPRRARRRARHRAGRPASATAGPSSTARPSTSRPWCGRPASVRSSTGSTCRSSARTAGRRDARRGRGRCPASSSAGCRFQYSFSSMVLPGVGRDAAYVAERIVERARARRAAVPVGLTGGRPRRIAREAGGRDGRAGRPGPARETFERGDWGAAFDAWSERRPRRPEPPTTWSRWPPRPSCSGATTTRADALQRAFRLHLDAGDRRPPPAAPSG